MKNLTISLGLLFTKKKWQLGHIQGLFIVHNFEQRSFYVNWLNAMAHDEIKEIYIFESTFMAMMASNLKIESQINFDWFIVVNSVL